MTTTIDNRAKTLRELTALSWELPVPPIWSDRYLLLFGICHRWANAAHQVARATAEFGSLPRTGRAQRIDGIDGP